MMLFSLEGFCEKNSLQILAIYNTSRLQIESTTNGTGNSFYGTETKDYSQMGYGVTFEIPLGNKWSFESGLIYLPRGFTNESTYYDGSTNKDSYVWKNYYVPLVGRFHPTKLFTGFIGGFVSYASGEVEQNSTYQGITTRSTQSLEKIGLNSTDYGITYGAGLNYEIASSTEVIFELRWSEGLANLANRTQLNWNTSTKVTTHEYFINLGFRL